MVVVAVRHILAELEAEHRMAVVSEVEHHMAEAFEPSASPGTVFAAAHMQLEAGTHA